MIAVEHDLRHLVAALGASVEGGGLQLYCVDSVDNESWYNRNVPPRWRIARHMQYEDYVLHEVVPLIKLKNSRGELARHAAHRGNFVKGGLA